MIRRIPTLVTALAVLGTASLTACNGPDTDAAARVNGVAVTQRALDTLLADEAPSTDGSETQVGEGINGQAARTYLTALIKSETARQVAAEFGLDLSAGGRDAIKAIGERFTGDRAAKWAALSATEQGQIAEFSVAMTAMQGLKGAAPADLEQRYENPASTGFYCIRFLFLDTKQAADEAYQQLVAGADFGELANKLNGQSNGGVLAGQDGSPCLTIDQFDTNSVDPAVAEALHNGRPGVVLPPVSASTDQGQAWLLLVHRPWSEIAADLTAAVSASPAYAAYLGRIATGRVSVASKYGTWNPALLIVEQNR